MLTHGVNFTSQDREAARLVCEKLRLKSVTLEGDLYDPQGTLTGGSRPRGSASLLVRMGQLADARHKASHAAERAAKAEAMLVEARKRGEEHEALASELEMQVRSPSAGSMSDVVWRPADSLHASPGLFLLDVLRHRAIHWPPSFLASETSPGRTQGNHASRRSSRPVRGA